MNLLQEFGVSVAEDREYSITFIDGMLACPRKTFLSRILRLPGRDDSEARNMGSAGHAALHELNRMRKEGCLPCAVCPKGCKIDTPDWVAGIRETADGCAIAMIADSHFQTFFTPQLISDITEKYARKDKPDEGPKIIGKYRALLPRMVKEMLNVSVNLKLVLAEEEIKGVVGPFRVHGYPDLVEADELDEVILTDYKFRKSKPSAKDFPGRQLFLYAFMLNSMGIPVVKVRVIYGVLSAAGNVIHHTVDLRTDKAAYDKSLEVLQEDLYDAKEILKSGIFHRNHYHRFHPCEMAEYCESRARTIEVFEKVKEKVNQYDEKDRTDECDDSDA